MARMSARERKLAETLASPVLWGQGYLRNRDGSPRAYYVAVETGEEMSGDEARMAVCLVPRGAEEGYEIQLDDLDFTALTNRPVAFEVFTTSTRLGDKAGDLVELTPDEISVLPPIRTVLRYGKKGEARRIPVRISVRLTEIGTLELWCNSLQSGHRWQLVRVRPGEPYKTLTKTGPRRNGADIP